MPALGQATPKTVDFVSSDIDCDRVYFQATSLTDDAQPLPPTSGIAARIRGRFDSSLAPTTRENFLLSLVKDLCNK